MSAILERSEPRVHRRFDRQLFDRIQQVLAVRVVRGRMLLEIYIAGPMPPKTWFQGLVCEVRDPVRGITLLHGSIVEARLESEGHVIAYTSPLEGSPTEKDHLPPDAKVRLVTTNGLVHEHLLQPLLRAKP